MPEPECFTNKTKTVVIKLCGHCSPRQDMMELTRTLEKAAKDLEFAFFSQRASGDILLIMNACEAACAELPPFDGPMILVTPETVNHWPIEKEDQIETILKYLFEAVTIQKTKGGNEHV